MCHDSMTERGNKSHNLTVYEGGVAVEVDDADRWRPALAASPFARSASVHPARSPFARHSSGSGGQTPTLTDTLRCPE